MSRFKAEEQKVRMQRWRRSREEGNEWRLKTIKKKKKKEKRKHRSRSKNRCYSWFLRRIGVIACSY